jgi:hypothetical protein
MRSFVLLAALVALLATGESHACHLAVPAVPRWLVGAPAPCTNLTAPSNTEEAVCGRPTSWPALPLLLVVVVSSCHPGNFR